MFAPPPPVSSDPDAAVRATDGDAAQARLSAIRKGYLVDAFTPLLVPRAHLVQDRPPLINIGTYVRCAALDTLVETFVARCAPGRAQIISLGAGSDARFWRLAVRHSRAFVGPQRADNTKSGPHADKMRMYVELDLPEVTARKAQAVRKARALSAPLGEPVQTLDGGTGLSAPRYRLASADLRTQPGDLLGPMLQDGVLDSAAPVLVLAECVLVYLDPTRSDAWLRWIADKFKACAAVVYEMYGLRDSFGRVMRENLQSRGVALPGADAYPSLDEQQARFTNNGFTRGNALSLKTIRTRVISPEERSRIMRIEMIDEIEELELVLDHYAISWGWKSADQDFFNGWGLHVA